MIFSGPSGIKLGQMSRQKRCGLQCTCFREKGIFKHISKASYCSFLVAEIFMSRFETWVFSEIPWFTVMKEKWEGNTNGVVYVGILTVYFKPFYFVIH